MHPSNPWPAPKRISSAISLVDVLSAYPNEWRFLLASESGADVCSARWSLLLRHTGEEIIHGDTDPPNFLDQLQDSLDRSARPFDETDLPFWGGWFVYLGYEVAAEIEPSLELPASPDSLPRAYAARCACALVHDHWAGETWLVAETNAYMSLAEKELAEISVADSNNRDGSSLRGLSAGLLADEPERFKKGVVQILDYIQAGDVFQVNLSRGWQVNGDVPIDPLALYHALRRANPAPFAGYAKLPGGSIVSSSPERLVQKRGQRVQTRPIAGTRPRGLTTQDDEQLIGELVSNLKERAEHIMLIDLERNDLGRVCQAGSIVVDELMVVESYEHVHHIVSNVSGELRADATATDLIRAVFPGGTITGCPKVRCMEIIAELEGVGRGAYTGAIGYISNNGVMDLNILIRSVCVCGETLSFRTGAGIVADSEPSSELKETGFKARGLIGALDSEAHPK
ncbi:MAG TPA: aminodeoxychorismate synthase component I [Wenzhouxiangella sp.]